MRRALALVAATAIVACSESSDGLDPTSSAVTGSAPAGSAPAVSAPVGTEPSAATAPIGSEPLATAPAAVVPEGFDAVRATVTAADGTVCELCLWSADDVDRRRRGLMHVTDLGGPDGMAFVYPAPHRGNFWMLNTRLPLSIAFFDADGTYLDSFDMEPCAATPCPLYPTPDDFLVAIEATRGDLPDLGIGPGSVLELTTLPCDTGR